MKKREILRGGRSFRNILTSGERFESRLVRAFCVLNKKHDVALKVGVAVSSNVGRAVRRNRLKRLMREAISGEKISLVTALEKVQLHASLVFLFVGMKDPGIERVKLELLQQELKMLCGVLLKRVAAGQTL
jgi:ribonuclease P protein component